MQTMGLDASASPPRTLYTLADVEERLQTPPTPETDFLDFNAIAGAGTPLFSSLFEQSSPEAQAYLCAYVQNRRARMPSLQQALETRFVRSARGAYWNNCFRSIGRLKEILDRHGLCYPNMGPKSLAAFNAVLRAYELPVIVPQKEYRGRKWIPEVGTPSQPLRWQRFSDAVFW